MTRTLGVFAALLLLLPAGPGCRTPQAPDADPAPPRFRHWWSYYERAMKRLREGRSAEGQADLERALGLRAGAVYGCDRDAWRIRTYGLHFLEGYFPNRELGICLLKQGRVTDALPYLEKSLRSAPSGRAKHYLNLAWEKTAGASPVAPPAIDLDPACRPGWTREQRLALSGAARSAARIRSLRIHGAPAFIELAEHTIGFTNTFTLRPGTNRVTIEARDLVGRTASREFTWVADWNAPALAIASVRPEGRGAAIEATCTDEGALVRVAIDGVPVFAAQAAAATRRTPVRFTVPPLLPVVIEAEDAAGNRLHTTLSLDRLQSDGLLNGEAGRLATLQCAAGLPDTGLPVTVPPPEDRLPPTLRLAAAGDTLTVFDDELFLDGRATDGGGLAAITVNGEDLLDDSSRGVRQHHFARRVPLEPGTNHFDIAAVDRAGNRLTRALTVVRRQPDYMDPAYRLRAGVPPVVTPAPSSWDVPAKRHLEQELVRPPARFQLLERDEGWEHILREQGLSVSDLADPAAALKIGRMLPAEVLFMGTLLAEAEGCTFYVKAVQSATGEILFGEDVYVERIERDLAEQVGGLALKLRSRFPVLGGDVTGAGGGHAQLSVGAGDGIGVGARFIVIKRRPGTAGEVCRFGDGWVELEVKRVTARSATARVLPASASDVVEKGDGIYAR